MMLCSIVLFVPSVSVCACIHDRQTIQFLSLTPQLYIFIFNTVVFPSWMNIQLFYPKTKVCVLTQMFFIIILGVRIEDDCETSLCKGLHGPDCYQRRCEKAESYAIYSSP
eukprot:m.27936 g.27936  ORF g.27936 m.27936 type:complete len:110 (-) comp9409_c0_seq6:1209-1538(-)